MIPIDRPVLNLPPCRTYVHAVATPCGPADVTFCTPEAGTFTYRLPPRCVDVATRSWVGMRGRHGWRGFLRWAARTAQQWRRRGWM